MGVLAHPPGYLITPGAPTRLTASLDLHSQWAWVSNGRPPVPLWFPLPLRGMGCETPYHVRVAALFLTSDLEAHPTPLLAMARDDGRGKRPRCEGPRYGGRLLPSHRKRTDTGPN
jgi:hypothetical protein